MSNREKDIHDIIDILMDHLQDVYCCCRAWEGWQVGTMTESDFAPANEDDQLLGEIASEILKKFEAK